VRLVSVRRSEEDIAAYLKLHLPNAVLPDSVQFLQELPLTPNGKLDRAALAARPPATASGAAYREPATPIEKVIARVWTDVLGRHLIGAEDNFFALGGHSLLAIRTLSRLRSIFPIDIPMRVIFDAPSVTALSAAIERLETVPGQVARAAELFIEIENMTAGEISLAMSED
jgi:hypothetical protein